MIYDLPSEILILIFNFCINYLYLIKKTYKYFNIIINKSNRLLQYPKYLLFGGINSNEIYELDLYKKNLSKINTLPFIINDGTCIRRNDKIFIISSIDFLNFTNKIIIYNITKNQIEDKKYNLLEARYKFTSILYKNYVYCFGGNNETNLEIIDLDTMNITLYKNFLPIKLFRTRATIVDDIIYIIGGGSTFSPLPNLYSYHIKNKILYRMNNMVFPRNSHEIITINNIIYVIGGIGLSITNTVESYNILNGKWSILKSMHIPRYSHKVIFYNGYIMVLGGISDKSDKSDKLPSEYYDIDKNEWFICNHNHYINNYSIISPKNF